MITTNQLQHRESLRARLKFDAPGRYALNFGTFSGVAIHQRLEQHRHRPGDWQKPLSVRTLYFAAQPIAGVEGQYGSMYIIKGESTEITTYDEDGYVIGERVSVRRPRHLFFDEMSATVGYFTSTPGRARRQQAREVSQRSAELRPLPRRQETGHARRCLRRLHIGRRRANVAGRCRTSTRESCAWWIDSVFENYKRTNRQPGYGFAVSVNKALTRGRSALNWGYAKHRPVLRRAECRPLSTSATACSSCRPSRSRHALPASAFITRAVGDNGTLPQRTLSNLIFTYNALPDLRRTGLF